jgi:hypothetical protein
MTRRTPVYLVCSPRPRVGKTLVARLLTEFFYADQGSVAAFDLNENDPSLVDYLPDVTAMADIQDTRGQMALLDRLVVGDEVPKVVDLGATLFDRFFHVLDEIDLTAEARRQSVDLVLLFMVDQDRSAARAYAMLQGRFPDLPIVPVYNEGVGTTQHEREEFATSGHAGALRIPALPAVVRGVVEKRRFSFVGFCAKPVDQQTPLHGWVRNVFVEFRKLELRLLLKKLSPSLPTGNVRRSGR